MAKDKPDGEPSSPESTTKSDHENDADENLDDKSPAKMSNASPQKQSPVKAGSGKDVTCNVVLLDGENLSISLDKNDIGRVLFDKVCEHLDLIEKDYFGFTYQDDRGPTHLKYWLNLDKKVSKQKKRGAWVFDFAVKFYPPDPSALRESLTRWLIVLQVRRDLLSGRIPCTFTTYAILGSYNVQADVGEYDPADHGNTYDYIRNMTFAPNQTPELLEKIAELHKQHKGQTPDEAEKCFLDNAKKLAMYGVDLHKAKDADNNAVMLGVCCSGLLIYRDKLRVNRFVWPKILKLSYKRNHFYIKIRPGELEKGEATIMFKLDNHRLAKRLWKTCVEHHAFFRLRESEKPVNNVSFPRFGSKFRYSGRTLYETQRNTALLDRPPPFFERSQPDRRSQSMSELDKGRNRDSYDPTKSRTLDRDGRARGDPDAYGRGGRGLDSRSDDEGTLSRRPYGDDSMDRRDRVPSQGDATLEREKARGKDDSMGVLAGNLESPDGKKETDKERRKREKEEDRKRKEEEKKKKKGKDLDTSEDRMDKKDAGNATLNSAAPGAGLAGLEGAGRLYVPKQYLYNKDGNPYNRQSNGILVDPDRKPYAANAYLYDKNGTPYDGNRYLYDKQGRPYDKDELGNLFDKDGKPYDGTSELYDKYGRPYGRDKKGNLYELDGTPYNGQGFLYDKNGRPYEGKGVLYDEEGKPYDGKGYLYDQYGRPYDGYGEPFYKDAKGNLYDMDGRPYDGKNYLYDPYGRPYERDANGNLFDKDGLPYDGKGYLFDKTGKPYDGNKYLYDKYGRPYDTDAKGNLIDQDGKPYDGKSDLYDKYGRPYDRDHKGKLYDRDGKPYDGRGFLYDKDGRPYVGKGSTHDDGGKPYGGKGYLFDKDGRPYEGVGEPYYKDSEGNLYTLDGTPYDGRRSLFDKDGRPYDRDSKGNLYNPDGKQYDGKRFLYDENGRPYDGRRNVYDKYGSPYDRDSKGNLYDRDGKPYDGSEDIYDKDGVPYKKDKDGNLLEHNGQPFDDRPFLFDKDGKPYNGKGIPYDEDGRPFDSRGYLFDKDKKPYNGNGLPYYMDGKGNLYDTEGRPYDGSRDLYDKYGRPFDRDKKGNLVDRDGKPYDAKGYLFDENGKPYDGNKPLYDKYGRPYETDNKGNLHDKDGRPYDGKSDVYDKYGRPYERDNKGNLYDSEGRPYDGKGLLYDKAGKPYIGTGHPHNDAGKSYDGKGYLYDKDKKPYNFKGYPYYMDSKGNLYDLDGRPYDPSKDGRDAKDGKKYGLFGKLKGDTPDKGAKVKGDDKADGLKKQNQKEEKSKKEKKKGPASSSSFMASLCVGRSPVKKGGLYTAVPYGMGLGVGKGDMTGVVGDEQEIDNYQTFAPIPKPVKETKESLKSGYSDNMMPFFSPAATSTVGRGKVPPPVPPKGNHSMDDSFNPPTVATEKVKYNPNFDDSSMSSRNIPLVKTETRTITYERDGCPSDFEDGVLVSAQSHSSRLQTIETTTFKTEIDGMEQTRVVQKVVMSGDETDDYDFDAALADAIRSVTEFNPDMSVERIECVQQIEDVNDRQ